VRNLDWHVHVCWISGYADALGHGVLYPRWIDTPNAGLGAPVFLLYPPLGHFIGALVALGSDAAIGLKVLVSLATLLQFSGARHWFGLHTSRGTASLLATAFCIAPQAVAPGYWFNMPASAIGLAFAAWTLALVDPHRSTSARQLAGLCLASGAMLLSHLPTALTTLPALCALLLATLRACPVAAAWRAGALLGGTLLASPYLLAAWLSIDLLHSDTLWQNPLWRIQDNLWPLVGDPSTRSLAENAAWFRASAYGGLAVGLLATLALWHRRRLDGTAVLLGLAGLLCFALMFRLSIPVYEALPALQWLQFGWRWQGVFLVVVLSLLARALGNSHARVAPALGLLAVGAFAALSLLGPDPTSPFWARGRTVVENTEAAAKRCIWDTLEHRPRWMGDGWQVGSRELPQAPQVLDGRIHVLAATRGPHARDYRLHVDFPARVRLDALAFPGLVVERNGRVVAFDIGANGLIELDLDAGPQLLSLRYSAPLQVRVAEGVSLVMLSVLTWLLGRPRQHARTGTLPTRGATGRRG